jgi:hypothetical protein
MQVLVSHFLSLFVTQSRVQWDPERDLYSAERKQPRRLLRTRAIQIGLAGNLSQYYTDHILSIQDVTNLSQRVGTAHGLKTDTDVANAMKDLKTELPDERPYLPNLPKSKLIELAMLPGPAADAVQQIGRGKFGKEKKISIEED